MQPLSPEYGPGWGRLKGGGTGQVPCLFHTPYLFPTMNVLPRKYVDCMSVTCSCSSKLVENTASRSSKELYWFLSSNLSSVLFCSIRYFAVGLLGHAI